MTENQTTIPDQIHLTRKVSIQERSVLVGEMIVVNGFGVDRTLLKQRFAEGGYEAHETHHFILFRRSDPPSILVHWFPPKEMNADIKHYLMQELKPLGLLACSQDFGTLFAGIIGSFCPEDARLARLWGENAATLSFVSLDGPYSTSLRFLCHYWRVRYLVPARLRAMRRSVLSGCGL